MKNEVFESYSISKSVAVMAIPTTVGSVVMMFYNMADTFFIGQTGDPNQVAAIAITMPVFFLMMAIGNLFGIGGSSLISRCLGKGDLVKARSVTSFCFYGCIAAGLLTSVIFQILMSPVLSFLGASEVTSAHARDYLSVVSLGAVFVVTQAAFVNIVRAEGASTAAMTGQLIGTVTNIILDPVFVLIFHKGAWGVGVATVIGNALSFFYYIFYMRFSKTELSISPRMFRVKDGIAKEVFTVGVPSALTNVLSSAGYLIYNKVMVSYGDIAVAASSVATKGGMFVDTFQQGIAMGIQPLVGYCYGKKNFPKMKKIVRFSITVTIVIGASTLGLMMLFSQQFVRAFIDNDEVLEMGTVFVRIFIITAPISGILATLQSAFQGMGKAVPGLVLTVSRQGLLFIPCIFIGNAVAGMTGVVASQPISVVGSTIIAVVMYLILVKRYTALSNEPERLEPKQSPA